MLVIERPKEMQAWSEDQRRAGKRIGLVPTMGYLHEGHLSLVRAAHTRAVVVVVSIFVNPIQFGPEEDFIVYPRDFDRDYVMLRRATADVIYHPRVEELYPSDYATYVKVEHLTETLCGAKRPGHLQGVVTVVTKLFNAVKPHVAVFGAKDAQQAYAIRRMTRDLDFDIEIIVAPTVREPDGLALSSRNSYLSPEERAQAPVLFQALQHGAEVIARGERDPQVVIKTMAELIGRTAGRMDYISVVDTATLHDVKEVKGEVLIALAVFFGKTRLIDNVVVQAR
jgi:pantoate--beta-alanine ligase